MVLQYGMAEGIQVRMEGPFGGPGSAAKLVTIDLPKENWKGGESPYFQSVEVEGVTLNSMVNLQLTQEQLQRFHDLDLAFTTVNEDGAVSVYAIGEKPGEDWQFQATVVEVLY